MAFTQEDREDLAAVVEAALEKRRQYNPKYNDFIEMLIEERRVRKRRWEKVKTQVIGWGILSALSFLGWIGVKVFEAWETLRHTPHG